MFLRGIFGRNIGQNPVAHWGGACRKVNGGCVSLMRLRQMVEEYYWN